MLNSLRAALICIFLGMWHVVVAATSGSEDTSAARAEAIDFVWAGQRVWFDFISQGDYQLVAYYDASRQMSVALRQLGDVNGAPWIYHKLPSYLGWDAHNSITAAFDADGHIHIVGNLHTNPLVYFRSTKPYDPRSLIPVKQMVSAAHEERMTYPGFFVDRQRQLFFKYRDGSSNRGSWYYLSWDNSAKQWRNTYKKPVLDGQGQRSVYPYGPVFGTGPPSPSRRRSYGCALDGRGGASRSGETAARRRGCAPKAPKPHKPCLTPQAPLYPRKPCPGPL